MSSITPEGRTGLFIVFEGVEGAGKTTHLRRLSRRLDQLGIAHVVVREPGGTPAGERIRDILLDPGSELFSETELLLLLAARAEFVRRVVRPALERGELVLGDRYELSTLAYQGAARGIGTDKVREINASPRRVCGLTARCCFASIPSPVAAGRPMPPTGWRGSLWHSTGPWPTRTRISPPRSPR